MRSGPPPAGPMPDQPVPPPRTNISRLAARQAGAATGGVSENTEPLQIVELREGQLFARKELVDLGEVVVSTAVDETPGHLEVDALREEVEVEHVPVGDVVSERRDPWEEDGVLVVPLYEEQLVVVKRLVLREKLLVRRVASSARQVFDEPLRRERLVVEDVQGGGFVRELFPKPDEATIHAKTEDRPGLLEKIVRKAME